MLLSPAISHHFIHKLITNITQNLEILRVADLRVRDLILSYYVIGMRQLQSSYLLLPLLAERKKVSTVQST